MKLTPFITPLELKKLLPLSKEEEKTLISFKKEARNLVLHPSYKKALLIGPCSVQDEDSLFYYTEKLAALKKQVENDFFIVLRFFVEKSRTYMGWKGFALDPYLDNSYQIEEGLIRTRKMLIELLKKGIPVATEFVDPFIAPYIQDLITWGLIGARSSMTASHRQMASLWDFPVGFKNPLNGDLFPAIAGAHISSQMQRFLSLNEEGKIAYAQTDGNPYTHIVLRGSDNDVNFEENSILHAQEEIKKTPINSKIMIDCSHGNSQKNPLNQKEVFLYWMGKKPLAFSSIIGFMLESFIHGGNQPMQMPLKWGISVTDACLSWEETESLILESIQPSLSL
jgi:3-deoxy-7-phosphoheptulonate synthase